jgi:hypothetical protein
VRRDGGEPENQSERGAAKRFGISRKTVSKMVRHAVPPGYQRKELPVSPKLGPFIGIVNRSCKRSCGSQEAAAYILF